MTSQDSHRDHLLAIAAGDSSALEALYAEAKDSVFGLVLAILGTRDGAEDVLVEVFVQIWRRAAGFDPTKGAARVWIASVARHLAIDHLRRRRRGLPRASDAEDWDQQESPAPTPFLATVNGEVAGSVRRAVGRLDEGQRRAVEAVYFEGLTHVEAAEVLEQPLGTLKGRVRAALTSLRRDLGHREDGTG